MRSLMLRSAARRHVQASCCRAALELLCAFAFFVVSSHYFRSPRPTHLICAEMEPPLMQYYSMKVSSVSKIEISHSPGTKVILKLTSVFINNAFIGLQIANHIKAF